MADFNARVDAIRASLSALVSDFEDSVESHNTAFTSFTAIHRLPSSPMTFFVRV